jgi:molecular chaperone DnaK
MPTIGFDFGTTNSLISIVRGDTPISYLDPQQQPIPSIVSYEGMKVVAGREAKKRLDKAGLGVHGNTVRSPKMFLGDEAIHLDGMQKDPVDVVSDVVKHVLDVAKRRNSALAKDANAVVTIPVDMDGIRRRRLREAFSRAGIQIEQFVHEPLAALYGLFRRHDLADRLRRYDRKLVLVFDWGGGTLDLTLCRFDQGMVVQVLNDGTDLVGGDRFDETLRNRIVQRVMLDRGLDDSVAINPGAQSRLLEQCERAKIDLSSRERAQIYVPGFFNGTDDDDLEHSLDEPELRDITSPLLDQGFLRIARLLDAVGIGYEQVALCVATGGMSNMPVIKQRLNELFGPMRVEVPEGTATLISEGAAWIAHDGVGLHLAKNVDLSTARSAWLPLIKAGTAMPSRGRVFKDVFHLWCTDPRDGHAKFEIASPVKPGRSVQVADPRTTLAVLTVEVDSKAKAFAERLELDVSITDDLILQAEARSPNARSLDHCQIHNLEFGLVFPSDDGDTQKRSDAGEGSAGTSRRGEKRGALAVRPNVSTRRDLSLVPGEFLYTYDREYFDRRSDPPQIQIDESTYYQACSLCGRASNDPLCRCATSPGGTVVGAAGLGANSSAR